MQDLRDWITQQEGTLALVGAVSVMLLVLSMLATPWLAALLPEDYFLWDQEELDRRRAQHPLRTGLKNLAGIVLLLAGIAMLFLPGQGLVTIILGLLLTDYPGKRNLEKRLIESPRILKSLNWLRAKGNQPPLRKG